MFHPTPQNSIKTFQHRKVQRLWLATTSAKIQLRMAYTLKGGRFRLAMLGLKGYRASALGLV